MQGADGIVQVDAEARLIGERELAGRRMPALIR